MASPFPGMDPYLEDPYIWRDVHGGLIYNIRQQINAQLPAGYAAITDERLYVEQPGPNVPDMILPDVTVSRSRPQVASLAPANSGGAATAVREPLVANEPETLTVLPLTIHEPFITILRGRQPREIVTIVEVLSPSNKIMGSSGRESYVTKQQETLHSSTNLLEIDLLRRGAHTVAPPLDALRPYGTWNYLVSLHRPIRRYAYEFWRIGLQAPLPRIYVPLAGEDADIVVDLQLALTHFYDSTAYASYLDYTQPPEPPLEGEDAVWADTLLREKGIR